MQSSLGPWRGKGEVLLLCALRQPMPQHLDTEMMLITQALPIPRMLQEVARMTELLQLDPMTRVILSRH